MTQQVQNPVRRHRRCTIYHLKKNQVPVPEPVVKLKWRDYGLEWIKTPFVLSLCALTKS